MDSLTAKDDRAPASGAARPAVLAAIVALLRDLVDPADEVRDVAGAGLDRLGTTLGLPVHLDLGEHGCLGAPLPASGMSIGAPGALLHLGGEVGQADARALADIPVAVLAALDRASRDAAALAEATEAENRVARKNQVMRSLFEISPVGVLLVDEADLRVIEANAAFLGFGNWTRDEVEGKLLEDFLPPEARSLMDEAVRELSCSDGFGPLEGEFDSTTPDSRFSAIVRGCALPRRSGKGRVIWIIVQDITKQKASIAEAKSHRDQALQARAELDAALSALPDGLIFFDAEDRVVMCNEAIKRIFPGMADLFEKGRRHTDILAEGLRRGQFPEARGREAEFLEEIRERRSQPRFERLTETSDGRLVRVIENAIPTGGRVGLRVDVTEEHEVSRRLADVIEGSQAGTWEVELATGKNVINDRWAEMLGYRREEIEPVSTQLWLSLIHPQDRTMVWEWVRKLIAGEVDHYAKDYRMRHADGHWVWITDRGRVSGRAADGTPIRMAGVHIDISALKAAEQRLENIIEGANVGTWEINLRNRTKHVNDRWAEMLGYRLEELEPMGIEDWKEMLDPVDREILNREDRDRQTTRDSHFENEIRIRHKDGHWVWILSRGRVTSRDEEGRPLTMSGVHIDITRIKKLEFDLATERDFLSQLMETSVSGIVAVDDDMRIIFCNAEAARQFGAQVDQLLGQICDPTVLGLVDDAGRPMAIDQMPCKMAMSSNSGAVHDVRMRVNLPDGRSKVLSVNAARTRDQAGTARVVATISDITAAAEAEAELRAARERAETANRAKSQFLANMSHELRTPLNGIIGMADLLAADALPPVQLARVETVRDSAALLISIVNDILDLAKVESGALKLEDLPVDLPQLAAKIVAIHGVEARQKALRLETRIDPALSDARRGDPQRLLQILHNVVGNAVKFTERGHVTLEMKALEGDAVQVVVTDSGIGMSGAEMDRVFDEFTQADGTITRRFGGTGLGLSIVRRLVTMMGGRVTLDSRKGEGTQVKIVVPMARVEAPVAAQAEVAAVSSELPVGLKVLVAEDNRTNQIILRSMLERLGVEVTMVDDGDEVVAEFRPGQFDLLMLDISMPNTDGVTALMILGAKYGEAALPPALAVTANVMTHLQDTYRHAGFAGVVAKPMRLEDLGAAMAKALMTARAA